MFNQFHLILELVSVFLGDFAPPLTKGHSHSHPLGRHVGRSILETPGIGQISSAERLCSVDRSLPGEGRPSPVTFHVAGVLNVISDGLYRRETLSSEWMLDAASFQWVCSLGVLPGGDIFPTRKNSQLPKFVSPVFDHLAVAKEAFTQNWYRRGKIYLFPPWTQISGVLNQLYAFKG